MPQANKPATTPSLPGALSTRTDGGVASKQAQRYISGMPSYGDGQELANLQAQAPMAATPDAKAMPQSAIDQASQQPQQNMGVDTSTLPKLTDPSARPWEHVTTPGNVNPQPDPRIAENAALVQRYLPDLLAATNMKGVPDSYRQFVNFLTRQAQANNQ
jgi:hypothetical protein